MQRFTLAALFVVSFLGTTAREASADEFICVGRALDLLRNEVRLGHIKLQDSALSVKILKQTIAAIILSSPPTPANGDANKTIIKLADRDSTQIDTIKLGNLDAAALLDFARSKFNEFLIGLYRNRAKSEAEFVEQSKTVTKLIDELPASERVAAKALAGSVLADLQISYDDAKPYVDVYRHQVMRLAKDALENNPALMTEIHRTGTLAFGASDASLDDFRYGVFPERSTLILDGKKFETHWAGGALLIGQKWTNDPRDDEANETPIVIRYDDRPKAFDGVFRPGSTGPTVHPR